MTARARHRDKRAPTLRRLTGVGFRRSRRACLNTRMIEAIQRRVRKRWPRSSSRGELGTEHTSDRILLF
jgi:hypothetical protein